MTWGARRTTVASIRDRMMAARCARVADQPRLRRHLDDPVARIEKALAPLDQDAVDLRGFRHVDLLAIGSLRFARAARSKVGRAQRTHTGCARGLRERPRRASRGIRWAACDRALTTAARQVTEVPAQGSPSRRSTRPARPNAPLVTSARQHRNAGRRGRHEGAWRQSRLSGARQDLRAVARPTCAATAWSRAFGAADDVSARRTAQPPPSSTASASAAARTPKAQTPRARAAPTSAAFMPRMSTLISSRDERCLHPRLPTREACDDIGAAAPILHSPTHSSSFSNRGHQTDDFGRRIIGLKPRRARASAREATQRRRKVHQNRLRGDAQPTQVIRASAEATQVTQDRTGAGKADG